MATAAEGAVRPWLNHYPEGISWDAPIDTTPIFQQVLATCARTPDADALDFLGKKTKYGELAKQINALSGALQKELGVTKGTRVALLLPNTPFYIVAYYAILQIGGIVVNCNPLYTIKELTHIVGNAGAELMVTLDLKQLFEKAEELTLAGHVKRLIVCHFPDALPLVKKLAFSVAKARDMAKPSQSKIADRVIRFDSLVAKRLSHQPVTIDATTDVALQQYTGGTTGLPKGAMLSHANVAANRSQISYWALGLFDPPSRTVAVLPFFHIFSMTACMNVPLAAGGQVVMLPRFELKALLDLVSRTGANVLPAVPTLIQALAKAGDKAATALTSIEVVVSGGAPLANEVRANWAKVSKALLAEGYGLTEASPVVCCAALRVPSKPLSIGQPIPGTDIRFIDVETGNAVPIGERGELQVKGPQVMLGYYDNPDATRDAFMDGWLRTGDIGILDEDAYVFLVDRIKDLILCSGFNVYPRTIEEAAMHHPAVEEVNVIGVPDEYRGEAPVAFVKLKEGQSITEIELKKFLGETLNKLELPKEIIFKDQLPKTLIGKLSKKELREEYAARKQTNEPA
jgi:long-chain acyl-CoA synthetase